MTTLVPVPNPLDGDTHVRPVQYVDLTGWPSQVLAAIGRYHEQGQLVRVEPHTPLPGGQVATRVHITRPLPRPTETPLALVPEYQPRRKRSNRKAENISACAVPVVVSGFLLALTMNVDTFLAWIWPIAIGTGVFLAVMLLMGMLALLGRGNCPGINVHCGGCRD
jgi:hypothetical protein